MAAEKEMLYGKTCSLCSDKLSLAEKNYTHALSDGTLCQKCHMTILQLLSQKKLWVDDEEFRQAVPGRISFRKEHSLPLEKAQELFALRDRVCGRFLSAVGLNDGNVFVLDNAFAMPKSPAIFILRAMKLKNRAVLRGFPLKGTVKKGDTVHLLIDGSVCSFTALDVVPSGTDPLERSIFFDRLSTNVHKHSTTEGDQGWIIIDTTDMQRIPLSGFAASTR